MTYNYEEIGNRLKELRKEKGLSQERLLEELENKGVHISRGSLSDIENGNEKGFLHLDLLSALADLYDCEIGYLLCEYDCKTGRNTDIKAVTGLSEKSIEALQRLNQYGYLAGHNEIETLNKILSSPLLGNLLNGIEDYFHTDYYIPVFYNGNTAAVPSFDYDIIKGVNGSPDTPVLNLARSASDPNDNIGIALTKDFFESVAIHKIQEALRIIKEIEKQNKRG